MNYLSAELVKSRSRARGPLLKVHLACAEIAGQDGEFTINAALFKTLSRQCYLETHAIRHNLAKLHDRGDIDAPEFYANAYQSGVERPSFSYKAKLAAHYVRREIQVPPLSNDGETMYNPLEWISRPRRNHGNSSEVQK